MVRISLRMLVSKSYQLDLNMTAFQLSSYFVELAVSIAT